MRPNTAVVITHRIEVRLVTAECPDSPTTAQIFRHHASHHGGTKLLRDNAAPDVVGRIGANGMYLLYISDMDGQLLRAEKVTKTNN